MKRQRETPEVRKEQAVEAALEIARTKPYWRISRNEIAEAVGVAGSVIQWHFGTVKKMRRAIMRAAIQREALHVIAQGIANQDPHALKAPADLKQRALLSL